MKIAVVKDTDNNETRCPITPESVKKYISMGFEIFIEQNVGLKSSYLDKDFELAGTKIVNSDEDILKDADLILTVNGLSKQNLEKLKSNAILVGMLSPYKNTNIIKDYADKNVFAFAMELLPRITRGQSMDVLSSQSNLSGYKAIIEAANLYSKAFPMMITAAGTVPAAKVFIMGVGVAGLQAIATARRLGAIVSANDVRPATKEQVESLGAKFIAVENDEFKQAQTAGGYAKEMSDHYKKQQADLIAATIAKQDIVITTANIPGKKSPILVSDEMLQSMKTGSVIVDLAVENGGNVEGSKIDEIVEKYGVKIIGYSNMAGRIAADASSLYAKNLLNFVTLLVDKEKKDLNIPLDDELIKGTLLTHLGKIVHSSFITEEKDTSSQEKITDTEEELTSPKINTQ
jgi:NAD(P) transhydrogenase subunit alpha